MVLILVLARSALAGQAPDEKIPWDSVLFIDTLAIDDDGPILDSTWIRYVTQTNYHIYLYGASYKAAVETQLELKKIRAFLVKRKQAQAKAGRK